MQYAAEDSMDNTSLGDGASTLLGQVKEKASLSFYKVTWSLGQDSSDKLRKENDVTTCPL